MSSIYVPSGRVSSIRRYLAIGDSTTCYELADGTVVYPEGLAAWLQDTYGLTDFRHKGVAGATSRDYAVPDSRFTKWSITDDDRHHLVTIGLGLNDCNLNFGPTEFTQNLKLIMNRLRDLNPDVQIILCTPNTVNPSQVGYIYGTMQDSDLEPYRVVCDKIASDYPSGVSVCHFEAAWSGNDTAHTYDGVHPDESGHAALLQLLQPVVRDALFT